MRRIALLAAAIGLLIPLLSSAPAQAQATRTWVSGVGDDANPCSRTAPCKTFAGAISKTAPNGEINVLDPGGFGAVTITKPITISSQGFEAGVLVSGTNGIIVNVPNATDQVQLIGLDIEGLGTGLNGVTVLGGGRILIRNCTIHGFTGNGINLAGTAGARVVVQDSVIHGNGGGLAVVGSGGAANTGISIRTTYDNNASFSTSVTAPSALLISGNTFLGSASSITNNGGATVTSFVNNAISGTGLPTVNNPLK